MPNKKSQRSALYFYAKECGERDQRRLPIRELIEIYYTA